MVLETVFIEGDEHLNCGEVRWRTKLKKNSILYECMGHIFYKICNDVYLLSRQEVQNILVKHQREAGLLWLECEAVSWLNSVYSCI